MHIDLSTAHSTTGGKEPPDFRESMDMLRATLEKSGMIQIKVEPQYVILAALKALNDAGYTIHNGSAINLSRPIRHDAPTLLSQDHIGRLEQLLNESGLPIADIDIARARPHYGGYLVDNAISLIMAQQMRAVDATTLATVTEELGRLTTAVVAMVGTGSRWGLPKDASITDLVLRVLHRYHNAWYRRVWRWFERLFSPSQSESAKGDN